MRRDIQGLRTVAVLLVVVYHLWPKRLTGGFVGVDVFFVISGFLITLHLLRKPPVSFPLLVDFWARRIRRLLPAATLVLVSTLIATRLVAPITLWKSIASEALAAAVYLENWELARKATDYLAAEGAESPVQHYWSLSVEEQFYIGWPITIALLALAAGLFRKKPLKLVVGSAMVVIIAVSMWYSWSLTNSDPSRAYFVTPTRIWELALGGLVAVLAFSGLEIKNHVLKASLAWGGLALILWSGYTYSAGTAFPGVSALIPTGGTALYILAATDDVKWSPDPIMSLKPSQFIGDISYSVYLWHWPLIVLAPFALDQEFLFRTEKLVILGLTLLLATASKFWVEDPVREHRALTRRQLPSYAMGATLILIVVAGSFFLNRAVEEPQAVALEVEPVAEGEPNCLGASASITEACDFPSTVVLNTPLQAAADKPIVYADDCWNGRPYDGQTVCSYGDPSSEVQLALVGNSHAGHWMPILIELIEENGWGLDTYLVSECYTVEIPIDFDSDELTENCLTWNAWAIDTISAGNYSTVIMSDRTFRPLLGVSEEDKSAVAEAAYGEVIQQFVDSGSTVHVLRDTPAGGRNVPDCVAANPDSWDTACTYPAKDALEDDPLSRAAAADSSGRVVLTDVSDIFCRDGVCHSVVGGLIAYFDHGHMSATFAGTLTDIVGPQIETTVLSR